MGVKLLSTLARHFADTLEDVDIKDIINTHKSTDGVKPTIVVDGLNALRGFWKGLSRIHGGQLLEFRKRIIDFVNEIREEGGEVIVFIDGFQPKHKFMLSLNNCLQNWHFMKGFFHNVLNNNVRTKDVDQLPMPFNVTATLINVLNELGCEVHYPIESDSDKAMAKFALENKCLAILAEDTDYLIFHATKYLFDSYTMELNPLKLKAFNMEKLVEYLEIDMSQLPLLAIVAGNDIVTPSLLHSFHQKIIGGSAFDVGKLFKGLARYIKPYSTETFMENADKIAMDIFGTLEHKQLIFDVIDEYCLTSEQVNDIPLYEDPTISQEWSKALRAASKVPHLLLYNTLASRSVKLNICHIFIQKFPELETSKICSHFDKKFFGIVFYDGNPEEPVRVYPFDSPNEPNGDFFLLHPELPPVHHPGLPALLSQNTPDEVYDELRTWLFEIDMSYLKDIPKRMWVPLFASRYIYLHARHVVKCYEVDALLCSAICLEEYDAIRVGRMITHSLDLRAVSVYPIFTLLFGKLVRAAYILNWRDKEFQFHYYQDGRVFHRFYDLAKSEFLPKNMLNEVQHQLYLKIKTAICSPIPSICQASSKVNE